MGGKCGEDEEISGHSTRDVGCGRLWRDMVEENGTKAGEQWERKATLHSPMFPIFPEVEDLPPQFPSAHRTHRRETGDFCHSPTLTATAASAEACMSEPLRGRPRPPDPPLSLDRCCVHTALLQNSPVE